MNPVNQSQLSTVAKSSVDSRERRSQEMASSTGRDGFTFRRFTLDSAVSPFLAHPTAPFAKTERKRAHTSALYYSECFLKGIDPIMADRAAQEAQGKYDKWWIKSTAKDQTELGRKRPKRPSASSDKSSQERKIRRIEEQSLENQSHASVNIVSVSSASKQYDKEESSADNPKIHEVVSISHISTLGSTTWSQIETMKSRIISDLISSGGSVETKEFLGCLEILEAYYRSKSWDGRGSSKDAPFSLEGNWLTLSKPTYRECRGRNDRGEYMYSLGRMSFDMFKPTQLLCSIRANFNNVKSIDPKNPGRPLHVPRKLMKEIKKGNVNLRTYDIVVSFTIEASQDRRGVPQSSSKSNYSVPRRIQGILTNQGYAVPDPNVPNRLSIWFTGGSLEVHDDANDLDAWKELFDVSCAPDRDIREYARVLAAKVLLGAISPEGMEDDGSMNFTLNRPIGGHGSVYCDIIYMDDTLRIMRGHHGSVYVCTRVPEPDAVPLDSQHHRTRH